MRTKILGVLLAAFVTVSPALAAEKPLRVVASFSILGQMVEQIGGDEVAVKTLVGANSDAHAYQATPDDAREVAKADLLVVNGLGFEAGMGRMVDASGTKARLVVASLGVKPRKMQEDGAEILDPHAWQDVANARLYIRTIASALIAARPDKEDEIKARARSFDQDCAKLDQDIREKIKSIPTEKRKIITSHDAFGYFGAAYGVTFLAPLGLSTDSEAGAQDIAALIRQIKAEGVKTLFVENMTDPRLMKQIAKDTGATLGGELYADALAPKGEEASTYLGMMRTNAAKMVEAMNR